MKMFVEELGGCLVLMTIGRIVLNVMEVFYSLVGGL